MKIILQNDTIPQDASSELIATILLSRIGLLPRKSGSTKDMHSVILQLYERSKLSNKLSQPQMALMSVEEMAKYANVSRQTFYEYLSRWVELNLIQKQNYVVMSPTGKRIYNGYRLNGNNLLAAVEKVNETIQNNMNETIRITKLLQNEIKKEKLRSNYN